MSEANPMKLFRVTGQLVINYAYNQVPLTVNILLYVEASDMKSARVEAETRLEQERVRMVKPQFQASSQVTIQSIEPLEPFYIAQRHILESRASSVETLTTQDSNP